MTFDLIFWPSISSTCKKKLIFFFIKIFFKLFPTTYIKSGRVFFLVFEHHPIKNTYIELIIKIIIIMLSIKMDFSENFSFVIQDEIQSYHWENSQCTLHPIETYFKKNGQTVSDCTCILSCSNFYLSICHTWNPNAHQ